MVRALLIRPDGTREQIEVKASTSLEDLNKAVGGSIQIYPHPKACDAEVVTFCNEEGMNKQLPTNYHAWTAMAECLGYRVSSFGIWGPVVIMGKDEKRLPNKILARIEACIKENGGWKDDSSSEEETGELSDRKRKREKE